MKIVMKNKYISFGELKTGDTFITDLASECISAYVKLDDLYHSEDDESRSFNALNLRTGTFKMFRNTDSVKAIDSKIIIKK
jgi:hypothetical protein